MILVYFSIAVTATHECSGLFRPISLYSFRDKIFYSLVVSDSPFLHYLLVINACDFVKFAPSQWKMNFTSLTSCSKLICLLEETRLGKSSPNGKFLKN